MALRHAVLAALLDDEVSGYQLSKVFAAGVAHFWYARPQQVYAELSALEEAGLISGRHVVQHDRPDKRVYTVSAAGLAELDRFAAAAPKSVIRDDLMVKLQAVDHIGVAPVVAQLRERAAEAAAKVDLFDRMLRRMRGDSDEKAFLRSGERIGPYLTCQRGRQFEQDHHDWCLRTAALLRARAE